MSYYEGLSCPVCNQPFTDEADVVVCPQCGLPHHRSCWATENHCHEADKHGTPEQWSRENATQAPSSQESAKAGKICPRCSAENMQYAEFCAHCGAELEAEDWHSTEDVPPPPVHQYSPRYTPFTAEAYSDDEVISSTPAKELAAVVGSNAPYYISRFRRTSRNKSCGWNWAACLLGPLWLLYRKQYVMGGILFSIETTFSVIYNLFNHSIGVAYGSAAALQPTTEQMMTSPFFAATMAASVTLLILRFALGLFGNNLYLSSCKNRINKAKKDIPDISSFELSSKGGVSFGVAVVFYFLSSFLANAITLLFL